MQITKNELEMIQTVLINEEDALSIMEKGHDKKAGYYYITTDKEIGYFEPNPDKDPDVEQQYVSSSIDSFLSWAKDKNLKVITTIYPKDKAYEEEEFSEWTHLARYLGISDLVVLSTKIPKNVAKRFKYYASREGNESQVLRELVYDYVEESIKDNARKDMFY